MNWFDVDKAGLAKLLERKGSKRFAIFELVQNCWDENPTYVEVYLECIGRGMARLLVMDDNPEGFVDLSHAFTLFAESNKKSNPKLRGRWNLGEKLVLALCTNASILSTKGGVVFDKDGRHKSRGTTVKGSIFEGDLRMTQIEVDEALEAAKRLIPPAHIKTVVNSEELQARTPEATFTAELPTEVADADGYLRRTTRKAQVVLYTPRPGEVASIYEMWIPVVETGDKYHMDVTQKVPLTFQRDNVPPAYLKTLRTHALNVTADGLKPEEATAPWVREAAGDSRATMEAVKAVTTLRFGEKAVAYDPSDPEANHIAMSQGYTVVHGGSMGAGEWENVRKAGVTLPAGQVTPSPKPHSESGRPLKTIPMCDWTPGMVRVAELATALSREVMGVRLYVTLANDIKWPFGATYGKGGNLTFNVGRLGKTWFDQFPINLVQVMALLIHEFAHEYSSNHLSAEYHEALCDLGAKMTILALNMPEAEWWK